jgi:hypothetical protein
VQRSIEIMDKGWFDLMTTRSRSSKPTLWRIR